MERPDDIEKFEVFVIEEIQIYIEKNILKKYMKNNCFYIVVEGYGRFKMEVLDI